MMWWKGTIAAIKKKEKEEQEEGGKEWRERRGSLGGESAQLEESCAVSC